MQFKLKMQSFPHFLCSFAMFLSTSICAPSRSVRSTGHGDLSRICSFIFSQGSKFMQQVEFFKRDFLSVALKGEGKGEFLCIC